MGKFDLTVEGKYVDAEKKDVEAANPWDSFGNLDNTLSSFWDFILKIDKEIDTLHKDFFDKFSVDILQSYFVPDVKDRKSVLPWGEFTSQFANSVSHAYYSPAWKDLEKSLPWNLFSSEIDNYLKLPYAYPETKDVLKTIFTGPNWFPKWCIAQYEQKIGEVVFLFSSILHQPYSQYFPTIEYELNQKQSTASTEQLQLLRLPEVGKKVAMYPSGGLFGRNPIAREYTAEQFRGGTGATVDVTGGFLDYPIHMNNAIDSYPLVCFDGYRTGPKDSTEVVPSFPYEQPPAPVGKKAYFIMNIVSLKRVSDNAPIPIVTMSVNTDMDSWCWSLSATLRREIDLDLVRPSSDAPVEVEANVNGNIWRFIIESYGDSRQFGQREFTITGRTPSALLTTPYSLPKSLYQGESRTAAQLADEALEYSGFTVDWQLPVWSVPGGAYSVEQQTPMQQLLTIAAAAGGVVHSAMATTTISVIPWYKYMPWEWGGVVVDAVLPTFQNRQTSYQQQPQYTGVYTSGTSQGYLCFIKRVGTDGSEQPQMVSDPLITATEVGLARGKRILADSGTRSTESISVPLLDNPGLLKPGMVIDVVENGTSWRGQVLSTNISTQRPTVTQSLTVLRYYGS